MSRVKRGVTTHARHKKVLKLSKGFIGRSSTCYRSALERLEKSMQFAYRDRRNKRRDLRQLWIVRINAAVRAYDMLNLFMDWEKQKSAWIAKFYPKWLSMIKQLLQR